ncbi:glycoside hydrolase family 16 protein [Devosia nitrariae]|uniref:GH16 domain-containing protein n=1 Tax=Devosia nitrariae TaxID=2071872 RepID=A0ABQ5W181_9HYPH|nr:glycoside hydrolase family 16 protein [Devosia nitrariae]GLQ53561.1 hypothetical protein GCM10010862_08200 [Devosia nitrariae]
MLERPLLAIAIVLGGTALSDVYASSDGPLRQGGRWTRVFTDEFDSEALDRTKWVTCYWWGESGCTNLGNSELQWYVPENVAIAGGQLQLTAKPADVIGHDGLRFGYTSGMVTSGRYDRGDQRADRFSFTYGYVEVRARVPAGQGLWSAIWLLPSDHTSKPEIDVMEVLGHQPGVLELHYHYQNEAGERRSAGHEVETPDLSRDWHVYGMEWSPESIVWYLDGQPVWRYTDTRTISHQPMYLLMNLAVGGDWPGAPDATTPFPALYLIDYVRIWQREQS